MGVKGWDFIPWQWSDISELPTKIIAIDAFNYMIRRMSTMRHVSRSNERIPFSHISIGLSIIRSSLKARITPAFVFDGPPETLKRPADPELVGTALGLYRWYERENDPYNVEIAEALYHSPALRTYFAAQHLKQLCTALGIPTVSAPSEAEMMCAAMCRDEVVGTVVSNDMDAILFGSPHVTRSLHLSKRQMECVTLEWIQEIIDLELEELRDLAIVCGCDFHSRGVPGIGPRKGVLLLRRHGGLEGLLKARGFTHSERVDYLEAREVFDSVNYLDTKGINTSLRSPIQSRAKKLLSPIYGDEKGGVVVDNIVALWKKFFVVQDTLESWL